MLPLVSRNPMNVCSVVSNVSVYWLFFSLVDLFMLFSYLCNIMLLLYFC